MNPLTKFCWGLLGRSWAHESHEELHEDLGKQLTRQGARRWQEHRNGAQQLGDGYAFQPGLVAECVELYDALLYVRALKGAAFIKGLTHLSNELHQAEDALIATMDHLTAAAHATIPASEQESHA
ncbi:hypothetical protein [Streptomyces sp. NPDC048338]|uniref:hypothetical protein n=1 Tax=Streptomyces sp. NPDC048338 TaxID=3365536 RepID=UPI00370FEF53